MTFNTIEDVNGTQFDNQGFWWYELDLGALFPNDEAEFTDVKVDFLRISKKKSPEVNYFNWVVKVDNSLFAKAGFMRISSTSGSHPRIVGNIANFDHIPILSKPVVYLYMGIFDAESPNIVGVLVEDHIELTLKQLKSPQTILYRYVSSNIIHSTSNLLNQGYNFIRESEYPNKNIGYLFVKLLKTDFQFLCNQQLTVGEVNTVSLGTDSDYKPLGDLVGDYETKLSILYNNKTLPVVWNESLNDYTFDLDLTNIQSEGKIRFKVIVEANEVLNASETDVALDCKFETIDTLAKLENLFKIGGTGRLSSDLTLTNDLTVSKSVNLIGNDCSIDMASHKLVIPSDLTFKAQFVGFSNGVNSLQQEPNSTVELNDCSFTGCTGFGSVIDCQVDLASLDETDDFNTKLTNCTISDCDMAILSGGNLEVNGCSVIGKISNKNYPFFLYQTDGNATILNSEFNLTDTTVYDYDIEFNSCIFTCGETATINGYSHTELQNNNLSAFFDTQRNTSTIDVKYYYSLIEDTVHSQSSKGFCHSVSGVDFVYKTNINLSRGD